MQTEFDYTREQLQDVYTENEIRSFYLLMSENITGLSRTELRLNKNTIFSNEQRNKLYTFIEKLKNFEPIQYILGETEFCGLKFNVDTTVLIPRPETEELVEWIKRDQMTTANLRILDIGTGSGCIAISIKYLLQNAEVSAFDISEEALETARKNAAQNKQNVIFEQIDILNSNEFYEKWDIIVSNPPYVPLSEKTEIQPNVLNYEPHVALFVPTDNSLIFYRKIADFALDHLQPEGKLYFEIHRDAGQNCIKMLIESGFKNVELRKDVSGNDRMIRAEK
ncbi:MAG: peptide chain release factor N(5)-glutamine methyltransferase [Paludibacter sp.]|nr:peptide chain release factor N(5)-glutamine methyltransferase [Paludibacter sp.]